MRRRAFGYIGIVALALSGQPAKADTLNAFVETLGCDVLVAVALAAVPFASDSKDAFAILSRADTPQAYVQCRFRQTSPRVICEISSGIHGPLPGKVHAMELQRDKDRVIAGLGFDTGGAGNHQRVFTDMPKDGVHDIAALMLTAQALVFDANPKTSLLISSPRAGWHRRPVAACKPGDGKVNGGGTGAR
jgi:hypothetical protein